MFESDKFKDKKAVLGYAIRTLNILIKRNIENNELKKQFDNATGTHGYVIAYLNECERQNKDVFQRDVEKRFSIRRSTTTSILQLMEKHGLINRVPVDYDARLKKVVLTEKAKKMCELFEREMREFNAEMCKGLSDEEVSTLIGLLERLGSNLSARLGMPADDMPADDMPAGDITAEGQAKPSDIAGKANPGNIVD